MKEKICCWISDFGKSCGRKIRTISPRTVDLYNSKRGYLCTSHQKANNNRKDYKRNRNKRLLKQKTHRSKPHVIIKEKKRSEERYFTRADHPYYIYNAAKRHWHDYLKQKFTLTIREIRITNVAEYNKLYDAWVDSNFSEELTPMITKINFKQPYTKENFMWITFEEVGYHRGYIKELLQRTQDYRDRLHKEVLKARGGKKREYDFL